jgi:hypothetical protein
MQSYFSSVTIDASITDGTIQEFQTYPNWTCMTGSATFDNGQIRIGVGWAWNDGDPSPLDQDQVTGWAAVHGVDSTLPWDINENVLNMAQLGDGTWVMITCQYMAPQS